VNKSSARKVSEFCQIWSRDQEDRASVVFVPGHDGHRYVVYIERNGSIGVRCLRQDVRAECKGNSNGHICYHALAALEVAAEDQGMTVAWCESEQAAKNLANLGGKVFCVKSLQGSGEAWGVVKDEMEVFDLRAWADELENVSWYDATLARSLANHGANTPQQLDKLHQLFEKHPERKDDLLVIFSEAVLSHGRNVLRGENVREI